MTPPAAFTREGHDQPNRLSDAGGHAAGITSLDSTRNKSPFEQSTAHLSPCFTGECILIPQYSGGRLDHLGGRKHQIRDLERIKILEARMKIPVMLTLTIDRERFEGPQQAYEYAMPLASRLLTERLGAKTWFRVIEVQTKSGDGWIHWHVLIDLSEIGGGFSRVARRIWSLWRDRWGIGGCDLKVIRNSAAGYMANYISKKWVEIPPWMGESTKRFRITGASLRAGELIRQATGEPKRVARPRDRAQGGGEARSRYRTTRTLFERLAISGLSCAVIYKEPDGHARYLGTIPTSFGDIALQLHTGVPWLRYSSQRFESERVTETRLVLQVETNCSWRTLEERVDDISQELEQRGVFESTKAELNRNLECLRHAWDRRHAA